MNWVLTRSSSDNWDTSVFCFYGGIHNICFLVFNLFMTLAFHEIYKNTSESMLAATSKYLNLLIFGVNC